MIFFLAIGTSMNRRSLLQLAAALPFLGFLKPKPEWKVQPFPLEYQELGGHKSLTEAGWAEPYYETPEYISAQRFDSTVVEPASHRLHYSSVLLHETWVKAGKPQMPEDSLTGVQRPIGPPGPRGPMGPPGPDRYGNYPTPSEWLLQYVDSVREQLIRIQDQITVNAVDESDLLGRYHV